MRRPAARLAMVAALLWSGSGWISPASAGGIVLQTPAGLAPGDQFRFVFVTDGTNTATSSDISTYDSFVQSQADGAKYNGVTVNWLAIGSTAAVNAIDHIGQTNTPVYLVDGTEVTSSTTTSGLWSGSINHAIDEDITGNTIESNPWTGTQSNGTVAPGGAGLGGPSTFPIPMGTYVGDTTYTNTFWTADFIEAQIGSLPLYGISSPLVVPTAVPEPSSMLLIGTAVGLVLPYAWSRRRREQRRQRPMGSA